MGMQYDVKASKPLTATGSFLDQSDNALGRVRIKAIYTVNGASAGSVVISDGDGGTTLITLNTPAVANDGSSYLLLPGEGILASSAVYGTVTNTASTVVIYG